MKKKHAKVSVEESFGLAILKAMLTEIKLISPRFAMMEDDKQQEVIDRLRAQIADQVQHAVAEIGARSFQSVAAQITAVKFGKKVGVTLELADVKIESNRMLALEVASQVAGGGDCMLVLASFSEFTGGMETVKPIARQRDWATPDDDDDG